MEANNTLLQLLHCVLLQLILDIMNHTDIAVGYGKGQSLDLDDKHPSPKPG